MVVQVGSESLQFATLVLAALAAVAFVSLFFFAAYPYLPTRRGAGFSKRYPTVAVGNFPGDSASQLRHVMGATFYKKKVMSKDEYRIFKMVETELKTSRTGCRVLSQTSLGEIIGSDNEKAFASINGKRVDILVIGPYGDPMAAIEYQGAGHHQGTSAARDAIKREALRKAGVQCIEILESHSPDEIALMIRKLFKHGQQPDNRPLSV